MSYSWSHFGLLWYVLHMIGNTMMDMSSYEIVGALVDMIPVFKGEDSKNMPDPTMGWIVLYIASMIPCAASNVYKEIGLKDVDLDIWYANAWVSVYQLLWGLLTIWTIRVKAFCDPPVVR